MSNQRWARRDFLRLTAQAGGALGLSRSACTLARSDGDRTSVDTPSLRPEKDHPYNGTYRERTLDHIAFPMGGIGAGTICLEGNGTLSKFSLRHRPDLDNERKTFAALCVRGPRAVAKILEGPVPAWKLSPQFAGRWGTSQPSWWGLPRFRHASFDARFPFATVRLRDEEIPLAIELTGWSPFSPGDSDSASLPTACLEYRFSNKSDADVEAVFSFNTENFMALHQDLPEELQRPNHTSADRVHSIAGGFVLFQPGDDSSPWNEGHFAAWVDEPDVKVNHVWFRGNSDDQMHMIWNDIVSGNGEAVGPDTTSASSGGSLFVPFRVAPNEDKTIVLHLAWYVPRSNLYEPNLALKDGQVQKIAPTTQTYRPWYAGRFSSINDVISYWKSDYRRLRQATTQFSRTFFQSTLPPEVLEAVSANLSILKSPTLLRQIDGQLWGWEGCCDEIGSCWGSCTHVWNYAQSIAHLFPDLERSLRETEFGPNLGSDGFQVIRAALPIHPIGETKDDGFPAAADGQLGGIIKAYRDWRISGDTGWLIHLWPKIRASLDYCIRTWDPKHKGWIEEPHLNTYNVQFWGADSLCTSLYLGALRAATLMGMAVGENVQSYSKLFTKGRHRIEGELFNGEYFQQQIEWKGLRTLFPPGDDNQLWSFVRRYPMTLKLTETDGPPYQYGAGCLADGVFGAWLCLVSGGLEIIDRSKIESHLMAVYRYNFKTKLSDCSARRVSFGFGEEAGTLICSWPRGGRPSLPLTFADEVWTGVEYQVASHLIILGRIEEGLNMVRACRKRYDGKVRNPFAEVEAGYWYARAMSSYALLEAFSGARYDAVDRTLHLNPRIKGDFNCFISTATGFGTVGVRDGEPFLNVVSGKIPYRRMAYVPFRERTIT